MKVSRRKLMANRRNAQASSGPKTSEGKSRSNHNAWRHGLSIKGSATASPGLDAKQLADLLAGVDADATRMHVAMIAAEAHTDVLRVQAVRMQILRSRWREPASLKDDPHFDGLDGMLVGEMTVDLHRLDRYEHRALSRRNRALALL